MRGTLVSAAIKPRYGSETIQAGVEFPEMLDTQKGKVHVEDERKTLAGQNSAPEPAHTRPSSIPDSL